MKVSEVMTTNVACVASQEPLSAAAQLMWECDCGAVPVIEEGTEKVIGMITDRDICIATWSKDRAPSAITIADAMSRELYRCLPGDSVFFAESLMRSKQIRRIPVTDSAHKLVGILSLADIARNGGSTRSSFDELVPTEIASTLANICRPHSNQQITAKA